MATVVQNNTSLKKACYVGLMALVFGLFLESLSQHHNDDMTLRPDIILFTTGITAIAGWFVGLKKTAAVGAFASFSALALHVWVLPLLPNINNAPPLDLEVVNYAKQLLMYGGLIIMFLCSLPMVYRWARKEPANIKQDHYSKSESIVGSIAVVFRVLRWVLALVLVGYVGVKIFTLLLPHGIGNTPVAALANEVVPEGIRGEAQSFLNVSSAELWMIAFVGIAFVFFYVAAPASNKHITITRYGKRSLTGAALLTAGTLLCFLKTWWFIGVVLLVSSIWAVKLSFHLEEKIEC